MGKEAKKATAATAAYTSFLPFIEAPEPKVATIGNDQTGRIAVPLYGGLSVGEAKAVQRITAQMATERGIAPEAAEDALREGIQFDGDKAVDFAVAMAHVLLMNRVNNKVTKSQVESLPMPLVMEAAQLLMSEANATVGDKEAGGAGNEAEASS